MRSGPYELKDRDRLMALVFALRLTVLSSILLLFSQALVFWVGAKATQAVALFGLFSVFLFFVSVVLNAVNFADNLNRVFLATPMLLFIAPNSSMFLLLVYTAGILFLGAFYREAREAESERGFLLGLACWVVVLGLNLFFVPRGEALKPWTVMLTVAVVPTLLAYACWRWQNKLRVIMGSLDRDETLG